MSWRASWCLLTNGPSSSARDSKLRFQRNDWIYKRQADSEALRRTRHEDLRNPDLHASNEDVGRSYTEGVQNEIGEIKDQAGRVFSAKASAKSDKKVANISCVHFLDTHSSRSVTNGQTRAKKHIYWLCCRGRQRRLTQRPYRSEVQRYSWGVLGPLWRPPTGRSVTSQTGS
jgi:hypothetical protein